MGSAFPTRTIPGLPDGFPLPPVPIEFLLLFIAFFS